MVSSRPYGLLMAGCLLSFAASGSARQDAAPRPPQFRSGVEVVHVDVSVLGKDRTPVRGLTAADFTVLEDGKAQEIVSFSEVDVPEAAALQTVWQREVAPDVRTNIAAADRLIVMLLDDAQVRSSPRTRAVVQAIGRQIVDRLGPADLAAVVFTKNNRGAQPFTADRSRLLRAVDSFMPGFSPPLGSAELGGVRAGRGMEEYFDQASMDTLRFVAESLADARHQRKAVFYVSPGLPLGMDGSRMSDMRDIIDKARRANVVVYGIDPSGLDGLLGENPDAPLVSPQAETNEFLHNLAINTGGLAVVNRNEFSQSVTQIFRENSAYYLIGYRSSNEKTDGKFRRIDVRVKRDDVTVRARTGYAAARATKPTAVPRDLVAALSAVAPESSVAMQVTAAPFALPGRREAAVAVVLSLRQPLEASDGQTKEHVDVLLNAYDPDGGRPLASQRMWADLALRAGPARLVAYELLSQIDLKPGRYQLRFAAKSALQLQSGSIFFDVDVPDFSKDAVSLSGVVLSATPNVTAAPKDRLAKLLPVVPTTRREFRDDDSVSMFLRVYQGGKRPLAATTIALRIVDASDATVFQRADTIEASGFNTSRAADYRIELPIAKLVKGAYLLTIQAALGSVTARRDVPFVMREDVTAKPRGESP